MKTNTASKLGEVKESEILFVIFKQTNKKNKRTHTHSHFPIIDIASSVIASSGAHLASNSALLISRKNKLNWSIPRQVLPIFTCNFIKLLIFCARPIFRIFRFENGMNRQPDSHHTWDTCSFLLRKTLDNSIINECNYTKMKVFN